jgi:hypothetical protein
MDKTQKIYIGIGLALTVLSIFGLIIYSVAVKPVNPAVIIVLIITFFIGIWLSRKGVVNRFKLLKANGYKIQAKILYISLEKGQMPIGRAGSGTVEIYRIICEGQDPINQATKTYKSSDMELAPDINIISQPNLDIYIDKNDPNNYWVDISKVPVKAAGLGNNKQLHYQAGQQVVQNFYKSTDGINYWPA